METIICEICGIKQYVTSRRKINEVCPKCIRRVITWGHNGAKEIIKLAKSNEDISVADAEVFCDLYYIGKAKNCYAKIGILKKSVEILGSKTKIIGRKRKYSDYFHIRVGNVSQHIRNKTKKEFCELCGDNTELHLHHIVPSKWGGIHFFPNEVMTLCKQCHLSIHKRLAKLLTNDYLIQLVSPYKDEIYKKCISVVVV